MSEQLDPFNIIEMVETSQQNQGTLEGDGTVSQLINCIAMSLGLDAKLKRFLYTGNDKNVIVSQRFRPVSIENLDVRLKFIKDMADLQYNLPFELIKRVMQSLSLWRNDEAILALVYCLRRLNNLIPQDFIRLKTEIYNAIPELLRSDADLFLFVDLSKKVGQGAEGKKSFGRGMKRALSNWYERQPTEQLANMFGSNRGMHGWTHKDIIVLCHMKFETNEKSKLITALFKDGAMGITELQSEWTESGETVPTAVRRLSDICLLKVNESPADAAKMIEMHNFEVQHLPVHLISQYEVWEILLPKMSYRQVLKIFQTLHMLNMLNQTDPLWKQMCQSLTNNSSIKAAKMHALEIFAIHNLYMRNERYNENVKKDYYHKKRVVKNNLEVNDNITKRLMSAVNIALNNSPSTGCNFLITMDLRESIKKKPVLRMSQVTCLEAMVLLALSYRKREKFVNIYSFSQRENELLPVKLTADLTLEKAFEHCETLLMNKPKPSLNLPFQYVDKVDSKSRNTIFITIVDSVARFCNSNCESLIDEFREYRKFNPKSKFIVLNLRRKKGDLQFDAEEGFLEICGLTPDTWRIINAFAINLFS